MGVLWLLCWCSARFRGWRLSDRRTWSKGVLSLKHRRCNETKKYHPAQQSPHENDWLPGNENSHGRTSEDEQRLTIAVIILRKINRVFTNILPAFLLSGCPVNRVALEVSIDSNDASRISAPLRTKLAQSNKVEPRAKIANVNVGTENDDVIL